LSQANQFCADPQHDSDHGSQPVYFVLLDGARLARTMRYFQGSILVCCLAAYAAGARAQQVDDRNSGQANASSLQQEIELLFKGQKEIVYQLNEIKRLLPVGPIESAAPTPSTVSIIGGVVRGDSQATTALVEYSDFECPYCGLYERRASPQVLENYVKTGKVKLVYRDLPLPIHPHAMQAARAAHCAGEQGKYWEMHDSLFANQADLSDPAVFERAKTLNLDVERFSICMSSDRYADEIHKNVSEAQKLGVAGTPTFFIGTVAPGGADVTIKKTIVGTHPYEVFKSALDEVLASDSQQRAKTD
jgi:protein-disulfide isomerase